MKDTVRIVNYYMNTITVSEVLSKIETYKDVNFIIVKEYRGWNVYEVTTGASAIFEKANTRKEALEKIKTNIDNVKIPFREIIDAHVTDQYKKGIRDESGLILGKFQEIIEDGKYTGKFRKVGE